MSRHRAHKLAIRPTAGGSFELYGEILGRRIRERSRNRIHLETRKNELLIELATHRGALGASQQMRLTRLTDEQLKDAEAAVVMARGRRLVDCVAASDRVLPPVEAISCEFALKEWMVALKARKRSAHTEDKNERRVGWFLDANKEADAVGKITPMMIERWVYRERAADFTRLTDAQVLRAWLNFCVKRRWLAITPFEIDMKDLSATARPKHAGRILSPEQAHAYLAAALTYRKGFLAPYVILTTWLLMRESEARTVSRADMKLDGKLPVVRVAGKKRGTPKLRAVTVPPNVLPLLLAAVTDWPDEKKVPFSRSTWTTVRELAGLLKRGKTTRHKRRPILSSEWQSDIARRTGISYLYQQCGDIREVCRQAGNSTDVSFRHYLTLPSEGAAGKFYGRASSYFRQPAGSL